MYREEDVVVLAPGVRAIPAPGCTFVFREGEAPLRVVRPTERFLIDSFRQATTFVAVAERLEMPERLPELLYAYQSLCRLPGLLSSADAEAPERLHPLPKIAWAAYGGHYANLLRAELEEAGYCFEESEDAAFTLLVVSDYLDPKAQEWVLELLAQGKRCLLIKLARSQLCIGPLLGDSAFCPECLSQQLWRNRPVEAYLRAQGLGAGAIYDSDSSSPVDSTPWAAWVARQLIDCVEHESEWSRRLRRLDLKTLMSDDHAVSRFPQCTRCGDPEWMRKRMRRQPALGGQKQPSTDGGERCCTPEKVWERHGSLVSPITGAISSLGRLEERSSPLLDIYAASYFITPTAPEDALENEFYSTSFGKGCSPSQARASAFGEAIERISAAARGDELRVHGSYDSLTERAYAPPQLSLFSAEQYKRGPWLGEAEARVGVPQPFDPRLPIDWTPVWSLTQKGRCLVPEALCLSAVRRDAQLRVGRADSNGLSAGSCLAEAFVQGFLELVERDACAIWWYNKVVRPGLDLDAFNDPLIDALAAGYREEGWDLRALDLTHDVAIPVVAVVASEKNGDAHTLGFGAHFDVRVALKRALTEAQQLRDPSGRQVAFGNFKDFAGAPFLWADETVDSRKPSDFPHHPRRSFFEDVQDCVEKAKRCGLETLMVDLTRGELGLNCVRVFVPGLRHIWPRFAPGRLYDVPVSLGWQATPTPPSLLNPVPLLL